MQTFNNIGSVLKKLIGWYSGEKSSEGTLVRILEKID